MPTSAAARNVHHTPALSGVLELLTAEIVAGCYAPGSRLPPERELAAQLGASRATLREALQRLAEWRLVKARRGSGVVVQDRRSWSFFVLPTFLKAGAPSYGVRPLVQDLMALRQALVLDVLGIVAQRCAAPGALDEARVAVQRAWRSRREPAAFVACDFEVMRLVLEAAELLPAIWLFNDLAGVYLQIAQLLAGGLAVPKSYREKYQAVLDALESGDGEGARRLMADYLAAHDRQLMSAVDKEAP